MLSALALAYTIANSPPAIRGDFDHDGKTDMAWFRPSGPHSAQLIVRRGARGHPVEVIDTVKLEYLANMFLTKEKPGRWQTWCGKGGDAGDGPCRRKFVVLTGDTLAYGGMESSEAVAIWTGRRFEVVWLDD